VLVATNVAARGIDVVDVDLVVNYELPDTALWLTHRIGRTARNGASGRALTFMSEDDGEKWRKLRRLGAPPLRFVDQAELLDAGNMVFLADGADGATAPRTQPRPINPAAWHPRNGAPPWSARRGRGRSR
jgi:ATP-dependent RNA helicase RhlE